MMMKKKLSSLKRKIDVKNYVLKQLAPRNWVQPTYQKNYYSCIINIRNTSKNKNYVLDTW
jgi:hypothetical protein